MKTIVVLGMHRSATSLIAKGLNNEVFMGSDLISGLKDNPQGHFESRKIVLLNDRILKSAGGSWDNPPPEEAIAAQTGFETLVERTLANHKHQAERRGYKVMGWKDPRSVLTIRLFLPFIENPHFVAVFRDPIEVARSLRRRNKFPIEKGMELARVYNDRILKFIRGHLSYAL